MILNPGLTSRLLAAIEADSLVFLCGAGLSMAPPSNVPSAVSVSQICYEAWRHTQVLDASLRDDIDRLAAHFYKSGTFAKFIASVPWSDFLGCPNLGHAAIADLLISRGACAALSANFDSLIEHWAGELKSDLVGALTGVEAENRKSTNPLIKFHGCMLRDRENTLWTNGQLDQIEVKTRLDTCRAWMTINLPGKDLVIVGFWTDWGYLNAVLAESLAIRPASSVTVIDPKSEAELKAKAPTLWSKIKSLSTVFEHVPASGADALDELRTAYSKSWARKFFAMGEHLVPATVAASAPSIAVDALTGEDLYDLRRDAEGVPYNCAAKQKAPAPNTAQTASVHSTLVNAGAVMRGAWLEHGGRSIRVVNGAGQGLADVQAGYKEPPTVRQSQIVVCAGAVDFGVPARLIATGRGTSTIRPSPGGAGDWLTVDQMIEELGK